MRQSRAGVLGEPGTQVGGGPADVHGGVFAEDPSQHGHRMAHPLLQDPVTDLLVPDRGGVGDVECLTDGFQGIAGLAARQDGLGGHRGHLLPGNARGTSVLCTRRPLPSPLVQLARP